MEVLETRSQVLLKIFSRFTLESAFPNEVQVSREFDRANPWAEAEQQKPQRCIVAVLQVFAGLVDFLLIEVEHLS